MEKQWQKESTLFSIASEKQIEGNAVVEATFFCCIGLIPERLQENAFCIQIPSGLDFLSNSRRILEYIPASEKLEHIKYIMEQYKCGHRITAPVAFLHPEMERLNCMPEFVELFQYAKNLEDRDRDSTDLFEVIEEAFIKAVEDGKFSAVYPLPNLETKSVDKADEVCFLKGDFIYLSETKFRNIFESLSDIVSVQRIKAFLKAEGILKADKGGYICKMNYYNQYGAGQRKVMIKLNMNAFHDTEGNPLKYYLE